jgi:hypothetical protein
MRYLITPSLYGSYLYYTSTDFNQIYADADKAEQAEQKAYQDWLNCLNKVKTPTTEAQQRGIDFEDAVRDLSNGLGTDLIDGDELSTAEAIASIVEGGMWQEVLKKETDNYLLYGRADVIKQDTIYDIKRVSSYDIGKYGKSIQHLLYMECAGLDKFDYLISDGKSVYKETYTRDIYTMPILLEKIDLMVDFIKSTPEFIEPFNKYWTAKGE